MESFGAKTSTLNVEGRDVYVELNVLCVVIAVICRSFKDRSHAPIFGANYYSNP